ncbi:MAG TPA: hypothetical protein VF824_12315 [Thermoanaerobaculia bacterium]|jgi:hypothetical protein
MNRCIAVALYVLGFAASAFAAGDVSVVTEERVHDGVPAGTQFFLPLTVVNNGPELAQNIVLTVELPRELTLKQVFPPGACTTTGEVTRCEVGNLAQGSVERYELTLQLPATPGTFTIRASVTSSTPDPDPANDTLTYAITTRAFADLEVFLSPPAARVDPGTTTQFRASVLDFLSLVPHDIRVRFAVANGTITSITPAGGATCTITSASTAECIAPALDPSCRCLHELTLGVRASDDRAGGTTQVTMEATSDLTEYFEPNNHASAELQIYRWIAVTSALDPGPGTLRAAIEEANGTCALAPCKIVFELQTFGGEAIPTIDPRTPLPAITADRVVIDGTTETAFGGDVNPAGPDVILDGRHAGEGLKFESRCEAVVTGLVIGNFTDDQAISMARNEGCPNAQILDQYRISGNYIGTTPDGAQAWPNLRGVRADQSYGLLIDHNVISGNLASAVWSWFGSVRVHDNRIGTTRDGSSPLPNGASGVFLGPRVVAAEVLRNTISYNRHMGVAVGRGAQLIDIRENAMRDNAGLGIDWALDGVSPRVADDRDRETNAPTLLSARFDGTNTIVTLTLETAPLGNGSNSAQIDLYANDAPDGDGERWIRNDFAANRNGVPFTITVPGDWRGQWINATATRVNLLFSIAGGQTSTSELSNAVLVQ